MMPADEVHIRNYTERIRRGERLELDELLQLIDAILAKARVPGR